METYLFTVIDKYQMRVFPRPFEIEAVNLTEAISEFAEMFIDKSETISDLDGQDIDYQEWNISKIFLWGLREFVLAERDDLYAPYVIQAFRNCDEQFEDYTEEFHHIILNELNF